MVGDLGCGIGLPVAKRSDFGLSQAAKTAYRGWLGVSFEWFPRQIGKEIWTSPIVGDSGGADLRPDSCIS